MSAAQKFELDDDVSHFDYPPEKREPLNARMPRSIKAHLEALLAIYKVDFESQGIDPEMMDLTWVVERCLRTGIDSAWATLANSAGVKDMGVPRTPVQITALKDAILSRPKPPKK